MGHFNAGWPWQRDYLAARRERIPVVKLWAYDHLCLYGRALPMGWEVRTRDIRG